MKGPFPQSGLSILEVLIAATILAFLGIGVVQITDNSATTQDRVLKDDQELMQVEMFWSLIGQDWSHLYSPLFFDVSAKKKDSSGPELLTEQNEDEDESTLQGRKGIGEGEERFGPRSPQQFPVPLIYQSSPDSLQFMANNHRRRYANAKESHYQWIRYGLRPMEKSADASEQDPRAGQGLQEIIRTTSVENLFIRDWDVEKLPTFPLLTHVKKLQFLFWDPKSKKFVESLKDVNGGAKVLRGLLVRLTYVNRQGAEMADERLFRRLWPVYRHRKVTPPVTFKDPTPASANTPTTPEDNPSSDDGGLNP